MKTKVLKSDKCETLVVSILEGTLMDSRFRNNFVCIYNSPVTERETSGKHSYENSRNSTRPPPFDLEGTLSSHSSYTFSVGRTDPSRSETLIQVFNWYLYTPLLYTFRQTYGRKIRRQSKE